jgi:Flp pilus assembly pilin Flp
MFRTEPTAREGRQKRVPVQAMGACARRKGAVAMRSLLRACRKFLRDDSGLETVEYAIITGLIVAATITVIASIGNWVFQQFTAVDTALT